VEKVEKILAAEEKATKALAVARERAAVRTSADAAARKIAADSSAKAEGDAAADRESTVADAREAAAALEARASKELEAQMAAARVRLDDVAVKLAAALRG
jgi:hypothetical protein